MVANTIKPLVLLVSEQELFDPVLDLVAHLHPQNAKKPFAIPYVNPITPLVMNTDTLKNVVSTVHRGLPLIYNNYGMSGATAPITPGGTLALLTAELLAGLAFVQVVKPGAAVILGSLPAGFDMRAMMSVYTPATVMLNLACAEMMAHYRLPHSGTSGSGPGWGADLMAGGAFWLNHLTACLGKVGLAPFVGGNLDSMAFSPAAVVYADEVIGQARQFSRGFELSGDTVALDQIGKIGPAGNYLASGQTLELFRDLSIGNPLWPVMSLDSWLEARCPSAEARLREHTVTLLRNTPGPGDRERLRAEAKKFIAALNIRG
jgi:trimethylamine--corrinoid protein Co-methyltransferase